MVGENAARFGPPPFACGEREAETKIILSECAWHVLEAVAEKSRAASFALGWAVSMWISWLSYRWAAALPALMRKRAPPPNRPDLAGPVPIHLPIPSLLVALSSSLQSWPSPTHYLHTPNPTVARCCCKGLVQCLCCHNHPQDTPAGSTVVTPASPIRLRARCTARRCWDTARWDALKRDAATSRSPARP